MRHTRFDMTVNLKFFGKQGLTCKDSNSTNGNKAGLDFFYFDIVTLSFLFDHQYFEEI